MNRLICLALAVSSVLFLSSCNKMAFENPNKLDLASMANYVNTYKDQTDSYITVTLNCNGAAKLKINYFSEFNPQATVISSKCSDDKVTEVLPLASYGLYLQNFTIRVHSQGAIAANSNNSEVWTEKYFEFPDLWKPTSDRLKPVISSITGPTDPTADADPSFTVIASDLGGSDIKEYWCKVDGGAFDYCEVSVSHIGVTTLTFNLGPPTNIEGTRYTLTVYVEDGAGNKSDERTYSWTYNPNGPSCNITFTPAGNPAPWTSGLIAGGQSRTINVSCTNATPVNCLVQDPGSATWNPYPCSGGSATVNRSTHGQYNVQVAVTDVMGNPATVSNADSFFKIDSNPPPSVSLSCPDPTFSTVTYTKVNTLVLTASGPDNFSADESGDAPAVCQVTNNGSTTRKPSCSFSGANTLADGLNVIKGIAVDRVGNESLPGPAAGCQVFVDTVMPTITGISAIDGNLQPIGDGIQFSDLPIRLTIGANDSSPSSGISQYMCALVANGTTPSSSAYSTCGANYEPTLSLEGKYDFYVYVTDTAGWSSDPSKFVINYKRQLVPVTVRGFSMGWGHACIISDFQDSDHGPLDCWGEDYKFRLGVSITGGYTSRTVRVPYFNYGAGVLQKTVPLEVAVGSDFTCVRVNTTPNQVRCWGSNDKAQLGGDATGASSPTPYGVNAHTHGYTPFGGVTYPVTAPSPGAGGFVSNTILPNNLGFTSITAGKLFACGTDSYPLYDESQLARNERGVWCWGSNSDFQMGTGNRVRGDLKPIPDKVRNGPTELLKNVTQVSTGAAHACATYIGTAPGIRCWGANTNGQIGDSTRNDREYATIVSNFSRSDTGEVQFKQIVSGLAHNCVAFNYIDDLDPALVRDEVWCWGHNDKGQVGTGIPSSASNILAPVEVDFSLIDPTCINGNKLNRDCTVEQLAAGGDSTCVVIKKNLAGSPIEFQTYCWGDNKKEQAGFTNIDHITSKIYSPRLSDPVFGENLLVRPKLVNGPELARNGTLYLKMGVTTGCLFNTDRFYCWGDNNNTTDYGNIGGIGLLAYEGPEISDHQAEGCQAGNVTRAGCTVSGLVGPTGASILRELIGSPLILSTDPF